MGILGFKSEQYLARWIFAYVIYRDHQRGLFISLFASFKCFLECYSATTELSRKELDGY